MELVTRERVIEKAWKEGKVGKKGKKVENDGWGREKRR